VCRRAFVNVPAHAPPGHAHPAKHILLAKCKLIVYGACVAAKSSAKQRSGCPVSISLDVFGDRWSLLIIRDMMVRGLRTFSEFQHSGEKISTNILADRLRHLEKTGVIVAERDAEDARSIQYRLTSKGIALAPVMLELFIWAAHHEPTGAPDDFVIQMEQNRKAILAEAHRRWEQRDPTPLIPPFTSPTKSPKGNRNR
jgi:DNA-binding HxlR family transcriptional regulator